MITNVITIHEDGTQTIEQKAKCVHHKDGVIFNLMKHVPDCKGPNDNHMLGTLIEADDA